MANATMDRFITFKKIGDFYEAYGEQARTVGATLGLTVTRGRLSNEPMCGIAYHAIGRSIAALEEKGYVVQVAA
jgi:DNA mismatch repair protein MutS